MRATLKYSIIGVSIALAAAAAYLYMQGKSDDAAKKPRNPVQIVKTVLSVQKSIPITVFANGYVTAINTVDVRPQIQNVVRAVHVSEGQDVHAGQLLFTLDQRGDSSNVDKAQAQVARDRADLTDAEIALKRNEDLLAKNFIAQSVVDTARSKVDGLRSTMKADQAATQSSNIALGYNQISASISGRIGVINVHAGSLAQPSGTPMLTISQIDPIAVSFAVPERELGNIVASYPKGDAPVVAQLASGEDVEGKLIFIDNTSDAQSGTIRMKAQFANQARKMWPGMFVNMRLISRTLPQAIVVPSQAIVTGPTEKFVYLVQVDDTVKMQKIEVVAIENSQAIVSGLNAGTRIVLEGMQNLRPGVKIKEMQSAEAGKEKSDSNVDDKKVDAKKGV